MPAQHTKESCSLYLGTHDDNKPIQHRNRPLRSSLCMRTVMLIYANPNCPRSANIPPHLSSPNAFLKVVIVPLLRNISAATGQTFLRVRIGQQHQENKWHHLGYGQTTATITGAVNAMMLRYLCCEIFTYPVICHMMLKPHAHW